MQLAWWKELISCHTWLDSLFSVWSLSRWNKWLLHSCLDLTSCEPAIEEVLKLFTKVKDEMPLCKKTQQPITVQVKKVCLIQSTDISALKVPYYTVFHQFHTAVRGPTTLYSICIAPNTSVLLNSSCLKVALLRSIQSTLFLCLHL